jgi:hypothetical protein
MDLMADRAQTKQREIAEEVVRDLTVGPLADPSHTEEIAKTTIALLHVGVRIVPPEEKEERTTFDLIRASSFTASSFAPDLRGGESVKPGNITVDMRRLVTAGAQTVRDITSVLKMPWLAPVIALVMWDRIWSLLKVQISEVEAVLIWVMWMNCDEEHVVAESILLEKVNAERTRHSRKPITQGEFEAALATLEKMKCIQHSRNDGSKWWLRERVSVKYR